jgi:hypothetical protein
MIIKSNIGENTHLRNAEVEVDVAIRSCFISYTTSLTPRVAEPNTDPPRRLFFLGFFCVPVCPAVAIGRRTTSRAPASEVDCPTDVCRVVADSAAVVGVGAEASAARAKSATKKPPMPISPASTRSNAADCVQDKTRRHNYKNRNEANLLSRQTFASKPTSVPVWKGRNKHPRSARHSPRCIGRNR